MDRRRSMLVRAMLKLAAVVMAVVASAEPASAQLNFRWPRFLPGIAQPVRDKDKDADRDGSPENSFPAPDRRTIQDLNRAREAIAQERYGEALDGLQQILSGAPDRRAPRDARLGNGEDYFFQPDKRTPIYRSLKGEARRLIGQLPREGRDLYELKFGGDARALLGRALANGDANRLAETAALYFHTQAGYEAAFLLGLHHLDHGSPLAGALMLRRLSESPDIGERFEPALSLAMAACWLQTGAADDAQRALVELKQRHPKLAPIVGGRKIDWFAQDKDATGWLTRLAGSRPTVGVVQNDRWVMYRGDAARNASSPGSPPLLNLRWAVPITDSSIEDEMLGQLQKTYRDQGQFLVSSLHPLAVDDVILLRTSESLLAVDFTTGKRLWVVRPESAAADSFESTGLRSVNVMPQQAGANLTMLGQRIWDDATYGTLSSDGRLVFSIEDLGLGMSSQNAAMGVVVFGAGVARTNGNQGTYNRLVATEIQTGKRKWSLGGPKGPLGDPMPETYFLGPPLPLRGQLYVLAEIKDEVRLLALDGDTGGLLWSQQLVMVERNVTQEPFRRFAGVSPSYCDGVLICPTGANAVVAVDMATRALVWGYRYGWKGSPEHDNVIMATRYGGYGNMAPPRWLDGTATIVDGRVLVTPAEGDALHCLSLIDGKPLWDPVSRQDDLYVACVHRGNIILVGRQKVRAIHLADGKPGWEDRTVALPNGAAVTGRGFYSGNQYFLPLSTAEVVTLDLDVGKLTHTAKSRKGNVPGNLVCYKGKVISQGLTSVEVFYQVDAARTEIERALAANPNDAEALGLQGEMFMDAGKTTEAVASFRRANELNGDLRTRELLRDSLLDGLRTNFKANRQYAVEVEKLLDDATQRATFLRLMADGLEQEGQWREAIEQCLKLADLEGGRDQLDQIDSAYLVRRDRWVQGRLAAVRAEAGTAAVAELDQVIQARLKAAMEDKALEPLRRFMLVFGNHPAAAAARPELMRRLTAAGRLLDAEMLLWPDLQSTDRAKAGATLAELAAMLTTAAKNDAAAACYRELGEKYADIPCRDGKTGKELFAALPEEGPIRRALHARPAWPVGQVETELTRATTPRMDVYGRYFVQYQGEPGPFFGEMLVRFDQNKQAIYLYDDAGKEKSSIALTDSGQRQAFGYNPNMTQARGQGHLLLMSMGTKILGLDPLGIGGGGSKVLWSQDLTDPTADSPGVVRIAGGGVAVVANININIGFQPQFQFRPYALGPSGSQYVCFQRFRNLVAIDPTNGATLWIRQNIPPNSELFGDEEYIFVLPPDQDEAMVLRALDGQLLGKRKIPRPKNQDGPIADGLDRMSYNSLAFTGMSMRGRHVLTWQIEDDRRVLALFDPWQQKAVWPSKKFAAAAKIDLEGDDIAGVFEPDGKFTLLSLVDGRTIAEAKLEPETSVSEVILTRFGTQYFLLVHDTRSKNRVDRRPVQAVMGMLYQPIRRAKLYALDLEGKLEWKSPVTIEDQHFLLNQPATLPVLVFACQKYEQAKNGQMTAKTYVLCVDRRTGQIVYDKDFSNASMSLDILGDAEQKTVELRMQMSSVKLKFTDKPATEKPVTTNVKPVKGKVTEALWKALGGSLGTGDDDDSNDPFGANVAIPVPVQAAPELKKK